MDSLAEPIFTKILSYVDTRTNIKSCLRVNRRWFTATTDVLMSRPRIGVMTSLESIPGPCFGSSTYHEMTLSDIFITDLKETKLVNFITKVVDACPNASIAYISPQVFLRMDREQQQEVMSHVFQILGRNLECLQIPSFRFSRVEPLPQLEHLRIMLLSPKVIRTMEKMCPKVTSLDILNDVRGESLSFLPRGIERMKVRVKDPNAACALLSSGASQSFQRLHIICIVDIPSFGKSRRLPKLTNLQVEGNLSVDFVLSLSSFLSPQDLSSLTVNFFSRPTSFIDDKVWIEFINSIHGLEYFKMLRPNLTAEWMKTLLTNNSGLRRLEVFAHGLDDEVLQLLGGMSQLEHLSLTTYGDSFTERGMKRLVEGEGVRGSLRYLMMRDIEEEVVTRDVRERIHQMTREGKLEKVLLCNNVNWGFMVI